MAFRVAVLTVSDSASLDASYDKSGPAVKEMLKDRGFVIYAAEIVPDDELLITSSVMKWASEGVEWIITTGGTGFGWRDRTPEAIRPLIDKDAPGLVHLMMSSSLAHTPFAALSRPLAGTIRGSNTLLVTLPGSEKATRENLAALLGQSGTGIISHALELLRGSSNKELHSALAKEPSITSQGPQIDDSELLHQHQHHNHEHHHHHKHQSQALHSSTVAGRARESPYALHDYDDALNLIFQHVQRTETIALPVTPALRNYVLAEDVYAPQNVPSSPTTNVDGYAMHHTTEPGVYKVLTPQSHARSAEVAKGYIYRINTGAPLPEGTDGVIMVEDTQLVSSTDNGEEAEVRTLKQVQGGENVRQTGSDVKQGDLVLEKGALITGTGGEIGTLVFVGRKEMLVYRKPVVSIMSTGNELVDIRSYQSQTEPHLTREKWTGVYDTNRPSLQAVLESMGYEVKDLGIVNDTLESHIETLKKGLSSSNIILTTGGTSMGASDLLKPVIEEHLNGTIHFGRVAIKPGKPTTFASILWNDRGVDRPRTIFALPGNPASALVCFYIFVLPALRQLGGWTRKKCQLPRVRVKLMNAMTLDPRLEFHRVVISASQEGLVAASTGGQRSSRVASMSGANGLVIVPKQDEGGPKALNEGEVVDAVLIREIQMS